MIYAAANKSGQRISNGVRKNQPAAGSESTGLYDYGAP